MNRLFDRLNLSAQERRLVVLVSCVLFAVLNLWFVWPHFGDYQRLKSQRQQSLVTLVTYQQECARTNEYLGRLTELEKAGDIVLRTDQNSALKELIMDQAAASKLNTGDVDPLPRAIGATNEFFEQRELRLEILATSPESILDFLMQVASKDIAIRVKSLGLKRERNRATLSGNVVLSASFQTKSLTATPVVNRSRRPAKPKS